jgi:hypothetical protein
MKDSISNSVGNTWVVISMKNDWKRIVSFEE